MFRRPLLTTIAVLAVVNLGACGDDNSETKEAPRLTKAQFIVKASAICAQTNRQLERAGQKLASTTTEAEFVRDSVAPIFRSAIDQIARLRPPADDEQTAQAIVDAGRRGLARLEADPESLKAPPGSAKDPFRELGRRARAYGVRCV
jgi:hypothetical protein